MTGALSTGVLTALVLLSISMGMVMVQARAELGSPVSTETPRHGRGGPIGMVPLEEMACPVGATAHHRGTKPPSRPAEPWRVAPRPLLEAVTSSCTVRLDDGTFRMYFMDRGIAYGDSPDGLRLSSPRATGIRMHRDGEIVSNPAVLENRDGEWIMVYEVQRPLPGGETVMQLKTCLACGGKHQYRSRASRSLHAAVSFDGRSFTPVGVAVDGLAHDSGFASVPDLVLLPDGRMRLYFVSGGESIASAVSTDGRTWKREPGLRLTGCKVDPDVVFNSNARRGGEAPWVMYYSVLPNEGGGIWKAFSDDGLTWRRHTKVMEPVGEGDIFDPDVVRVPGGYRMFFGERRHDESAATNLRTADCRKSIFFVE